MSSMSKRQQARNERELHELLRVQGNSQCADCGARNPGWASWNLGIFLCMRCASLHRKLGTHISKVKSLSMDTWTSDQLENMKQNGNIAVNKVYNPKNRQPDMPLDADEVDSAMERFIRKKYQEKSLLDGKPEPPRRDSSPPPAPYPKSPESSPPPPVPSKKGRFFGFGLRASSSAYPLSKHDKKRLPPEPRVESAFTISSDGYSPSRRTSNAGAQISDAELQKKLGQLRDMGFDDTERNLKVLRRLNGNVERTVEALVKYGPRSGAKASSSSTDAAATSSNQPATVEPDSTAFLPKPFSPSNNPFDQVPSSQGFGLSTNAVHQTQPGGIIPSTNPFDLPVRNQTDTGLERSFQNLQVAQPMSQPLFPHSTGGYPSQPPPIQDPRLQHSMTPPVPQVYHQYGYTASPAAITMTTNPFFQNMQTQQPQANGLYGAQPQQNFGNTSTNPFFNSPSSSFDQISQQTGQQNNGPASNFNPFGIPPAGQSPPQVRQQIANSQAHGQNIFDIGGQTAVLQNPASNPFQQQIQSPLQPPQMPNFQYGQPQMQPPQQQPQHVAQYHPQPNPYQTPQVPPQFLQQGQPAQLMPQQTGRYDKNSILALYNYPQLAPQPLASIPEPSDGQTQPQQSSQQASTYQANPGDLFAAHTMPAKRSATMPVSSMHSAGGGGSRNPFLQNVANTQQLQAQPPQQPQQNIGIASRHASHDSVSINNLENGRHSPDAFASLSARYQR